MTIYLPGTNDTSDPTGDEMRAHLQSCGITDPFVVERAIYWFATDYHGGQASSLYAALSTSNYKPGLIERSPAAPLSDTEHVSNDDADAAAAYAELEHWFVIPW